MDRWRLTAIAAVIALSLCVVGGVTLLMTGNVSAETDEPGPVYGSGESPYGGMNVHYDDLEDGAMYHIVRYGLVHISFTGTGATGMEANLAWSGLMVDYGNESIDGELIHSCIVTIGDKTITLAIVTGSYGDLPIFGASVKETTLDPLPVAYYDVPYSYKFLVTENVVKSIAVTPFTMASDLTAYGLTGSITWEGTGKYATSGEYCDIYCTVYGTPSSAGTIDVVILQDYSSSISTDYKYTAKLEIIDYYTIYFDCSGGNVNGQETFTKTVAHDGTITLPSPTRDVQSDGIEEMYCKGWYTQKGGAGKYLGACGHSLDPSQDWALNEEITIYAHWVAMNNPVTEINVSNTTVNVAVGSSTLISATCTLQDPDGYIADDSCDVTWVPQSGWENYITWNSVQVIGTGSDCYVTGVSSGTVVFEVVPKYSADGLSKTVTVNVVGAGTVTMYDYTIRYHYNDGVQTYWTESFSSEQSSISNYKLSSKYPTRDGYTFLGWAKNSSATDPDYRKENLAIMGAQISQGINNFYAVWDKNEVVWTLKFNAGGVTANPSNMTANDDGDYHIFTPLPTLSNTETQEFLGWAKSSAATVPAYGGGGQYKAWTTDETLYAVWGAISTTNNFRLEYDTQGGTAVAPTEFSNKTETSWPTTVSNTRPTKTGYTFQGWAETPGAGVTKNPGDDILLYPGTKTLYAVWAQEQFVLTLKGNGGTPDTREIPVTGTGFASLTLTVDHKPTREGYTFQGWADLPTEAPYKFVGSTVDFTTESSEITLYAIWMQDAVEEDKTYTLYFDTQIEGVDIVTATFKESEIPYIIPDLSLEKAGFDFDGWSDRADGTQGLWMHGVDGMDTYTPLSDEPKTLFAVWTLSVDTWTVKLNLNEGYGGPGDQHIPNVPDTATSWEIPIPGPEPKRHGYLFAGWGISVDDKNPIPAGGTYTATKKTSELFAIWTVDENQWTLIFDANGGEGAPVVDGSYPVNGECTFTIPNKKPTLEGHRFLGWWTDKVGVDEITDITMLIQTGSYTTKTKEVTLYAVWSEGIPGKATLIFNLMGGTYAGTELSPDPVDCTSSYEFMIPNATPTKAGYVFLGWADKSSSKEANYKIGDMTGIKVDSGKTKMVYAVWSPESTDNGNGSDKDEGLGLGTYIAMAVIAILALFIILRFTGVV